MFDHIKTNGSGNRIADIQSRAAKAQQRLDAIDGKLNELRDQLKQAQELTANAEERLHCAELGIAQGRAGAQPIWEAVRSDHAAATARIAGLQQLIATQEQQRATVDGEYQTASAALSEVMQEQKLQAAKKELATADLALHQAQDALLLAERRWAVAKQAVFELESAMRASADRAHFARLKAMGDTAPGYQRRTNVVGV